MVPEFIWYFLGLLFLFICILFLGNYRWFQGFTNAIYALVVWTIYLVYYSALTILQVASMVFVGLLKACVLLTAFAGLVFIHLLTIPISAFGNIDLSRRISKSVASLVDTNQIWSIQQRLVQILVTTNEVAVELDEESAYRAKIKSLPEAAKARIDRGSTTFSLIFGVLLLLISNGMVPIGRLGPLPITTLKIVEVYLLFLSVAVLYRIAFLDILAFDGSEDFSTLEEWHVAQTVQKGICQLKVVEVGLLLLSIGPVFAPRQIRIGFQLLEELYSGELAWSPSALISRGLEVKRSTDEESYE